MMTCGGCQRSPSKPGACLCASCARESVAGLIPYTDARDALAARASAAFVSRRRLLELRERADLLRDQITERQKEIAQSTKRIEQMRKNLDYASRRCNERRASFDARQSLQGFTEFLRTERGRATVQRLGSLSSEMSALACRFCRDLLSFYRFKQLGNDRLSLLGTFLHASSDFSGMPAEAVNVGVGALAHMAASVSLLFDIALPFAFSLPPASPLPGERSRSFLSIAVDVPLQLVSADQLGEFLRGIAHLNFNIAYLSHALGRPLAPDRLNWAVGNLFALLTDGAAGALPHRTDRPLLPPTFSLDACCHAPLKAPPVFDDGDGGEGDAELESEWVDFLDEEEEALFAPQMSRSRMSRLG